MAAADLPPNLRDVQNRDLTVEVEASNLGPLRGQKKIARAQLFQPRGVGEEHVKGPVHTIVCDEGPYLGGEDSAPFPLAYFTSGVAF